MTVDVSRIQGTYKIQNVSTSGVVTDVLIVDSTGTSYPYSGQPTSSTVVVTGNLVVVGTRTELSSTNVTVSDPTILLNQGNSAFLQGGYHLAGLQVSLDPTDNANTSTYFQWNNDATWQGTGHLGSVQGIWEFRQGLPSSPPLYSAIKINAIRMPLYDQVHGTQPEGNYSTLSPSSITNPRLNIFGSDNPTSVLSVKGTAAYESNCIDDDDIPNVKYVKQTLASAISQAESIVDGYSYLTINDKVLNGASFSQILGVLDGHPTDKPNPTTGTVVLRITTSTAQIAQIQFIGNQIQPANTLSNVNLLLSANGTGQIIAASPILFQTSSPPVPGTGQTGLYSQNPGSGGTGLYYVNSSTGGVVSSDEFVSRRKALVFSFIF